MNHLRTGYVRIPHHNVITRMELWGFIKSSALYLSVHMEFSLCLSFYLTRSLKGYTVGTTAGFPVHIVEALTPQSHHRISRKCPQYHMSTYSVHRRVSGCGHPLNGELRGYCRGNLPRVSWTVGYDQKKLRYDRSPPTANGWGTTQPVPRNGSTTQGWRVGATNLKRIYLENHPHC
jgi:hypothetical protein